MIQIRDTLPKDISEAKKLIRFKSSLDIYTDTEDRSTQWPAARFKGSAMGSTSTPASCSQRLPEPRKARAGSGLSTWAAECWYLPLKGLWVIAVSRNRVLYRQRWSILGILILLIPDVGTRAKGRADKCRVKPRQGSECPAGHRDATQHWDSCPETWKKCPNIYSPRNAKRLVLLSS